jgi:hypothetical protein
MSKHSLAIIFGVEGDVPESELLPEDVVLHESLVGHGSNHPGVQWHGVLENIPLDLGKDIVIEHALGSNRSSHTNLEASDELLVVQLLDVHWQDTHDSLEEDIVSLDHAHRFALVVQHISVEDVKELGKISRFILVEHPQGMHRVDLPLLSVQHTHSVQDQLDLSDMLSVETWLPHLEILEALSRNRVLIPVEQLILISMGELNEASNEL